MLRCWGDRKGEFYWLTRNAAPSAPFGFDSTFFSLSPRSPVCRRVPLRRYVPVCNDYRSRSLDRFQSASSPREGFDEEKGRTKKIYIYSLLRGTAEERESTPCCGHPDFDTGVASTDESVTRLSLSLSAHPFRVERLRWHATRLLIR